MNEKKIKIIQSAIKLFAKKGFDATSIQEIADKSGISKGAFYLHFRSKEELVLSLFQYYAHIFDETIAQVEAQKLPPREKLIRQLNQLFQAILENREVIILQFREQVLHMNEEIKHFFRIERQKRQQWLGRAFLSIYGESVRPYVHDAAKIFNGIVHAYLMLMIVHGVELDVERLAPFIVNRLDDIVNGMRSRRESPILTEDVLQLLYTSDNTDWKVIGILEQMARELNRLSLNEKAKEELCDTLDFLLAEFKKGTPPPFIVKGLLANFSGVEALERYRKAILERIEKPL